MAETARFKNISKQALRFTIEGVDHCVARNQVVTLPVDNNYVTGLEMQEHIERVAPEPEAPEVTEPEAEAEPPEPAADPSKDTKKAETPAKKGATSDNQTVNP